MKPSKPRPKNSFVSALFHFGVAAICEQAGTAAQSWVFLLIAFEKTVIPYLPADPISASHFNLQQREVAMKGYQTSPRFLIRLRTVVYTVDGYT